MKLQEGIKVKLLQVWKNNKFWRRNRTYHLLQRKKGSEKEGIPEHPPLPTDADFGASLSFIFKTSSLKPAQKFPATAYFGIEFSSPLLF